MNKIERKLLQMYASTAGDELYALARLHSDVPEKYVRDRLEAIGRRLRQILDLLDERRPDAP